MSVHVILLPWRPSLGAWVQFPSPHLTNWAKLRSYSKPLSPVCKAEIRVVEATQVTILGILALARKTSQGFWGLHPFPVPLTLWHSPICHGPLGRLQGWGHKSLRHCSGWLGPGGLGGWAQGPAGAERALGLCPAATSEIQSSQVALLWLCSLPEAVSGSFTLFPAPAREHPPPPCDSHPAPAGSRPGALGRHTHGLPQNPAQLPSYPLSPEGQRGLGPPLFLVL